jgi:hypothetical protein
MFYTDAHLTSLRFFMSSESMTHKIFMNTMVNQDTNDQSFGI